ncbi:hypothetical protein V6R21_00605 [Limibacter armeniacum]|uniref:hypothetical protein n=1 Tax=Limibacter armeniacum TaxID=466084 RepID=UPI002FE64033
MKMQKTKITALMLGMLMGITTFSCDEASKEEPCTIETDRECYCADNTDDEACIEACDVTVDNIYVKGDFTDEAFVMLGEGDLVDEYVIRERVNGAGIKFKFYNSEDGADANWGAMAGKASDASGVAEAAIEGADCGKGNEAFDIANTEGMDMVNISLVTRTGDYKVEFDEANPCVDLDKSENKVWLKGGLKLFKEDGTEDNAWGALGVEMEQSEENPDVYSVVVEYPSWASRLQFKPVFNPAGDWGESVGDNNIAVDWGPGASVGAGEAPLEGKFFVKAFELDLDENGAKVAEIVQDCTNAPLNDDNVPDSGVADYFFPGSGDTSDASFQTPARITLNIKTGDYKVEWLEVE